jgi:hypothetical protein
MTTVMALKAHKRPVHACDLREDFKNGNHNIFNTPQANLGATLTLENLPTMML